LENKININKIIKSIANNMKVIDNKSGQGFVDGEDILEVYHMSRILINLIKDQTDLEDKILLKSTQIDDIDILNEYIELAENILSKELVGALGRNELINIINVIRYFKLNIE
jgi:hypothetical protein